MKNKNYSFILLFLALITNLAAWGQGGSFMKGNFGLDTKVWLPDPTPYYNTPGTPATSVVDNSSSGGNIISYAEESAQNEADAVYYYFSQDYEQAFKMIMKVGPRSKYGETMLGNMYEGGFGTPKNPWKAFKWYHKAATKGYGPKAYLQGKSAPTGEETFDGHLKAKKDGYEGEGAVRTATDTFTGQWEKRKDYYTMTGHGIWKNATDSYEGEWDYNSPDGQGNYIWNSGDCKYVGTFKLGEMNGQGTFTWNSGKSKYVGMFNRVGR
jgi:hypothetical protein